MGKNFDDADKALGALQDEIQDYRKKISKFAEAAPTAIDPAERTVNQKQLWDGIDQLYSHLHGVTGALRDQISSLRQAHADHMKGHMPQLTPGQMEKLLKSCGADADYTIAKPVISYAKRYVEASFRG